jgi:hypothetical protein
LWELSSRRLPPGGEIVIRSNALAALEATQGAAPEKKEAPLGTREKNTQLSMMAVLCSLAKIDIAERGAAQKILGEADRLGIKISPSTISRILKEIPEAVERRKS